MKKLLVVIVIAVIGYVVYGWINPPETYPSVSQVTVIANTANSSAVKELDNEIFIESLKYSFMNENSIHKTVRADGDPKLVDTYKAKKTNIRKPSDSKREQLAMNSVNNIINSLKQVKAVEPELDIIDALNEGVRALDGSNTDIKKLVFVSNMFSTKGVVNLAEFDTSLSVKEVVDKLKSIDALPDMTGIDIIEVYGFAAVAPPQEEATYEERAYIKELLSGVFEASGAKSVTFYEVASSDYRPDKDLPKVTVIDFPDYENSFSGTASFFGDDINFIGNTATFVNQDAACQALKGVSSFLKKEGTRILVVGCTASGDKKYCRELSELRALAVKNVLVDMGASDNQIEVLGVGCEDPYRVDDTDSNGYHIESLAYQNRRVILIDPDAEPKLSREYHEVVE